MDFNKILESVLKDPKTLEVISNKVGLASGDTKWEISKALPILLGQLEKNSKDSSKLELMKNALGKKHDWNILNNLSDWIDLKDWWKIIGHIFGRDSANIERKLWNWNVLKALWPIVMGALWKSVNAKWWEIWDIAWMLSASSKSSNILISFLDKDGDWDIKDDLFKMFINWLKKKFLGGK